MPLQTFVHVRAQYQASQCVLNILYYTEDIKKASYSFPFRKTEIVSSVAETHVWHSIQRTGLASKLRPETRIPLHPLNDCCTMQCSEDGAAALRWHIDRSGRNFGLKDKVMYFVANANEFPSFFSYFFSAQPFYFTNSWIIRLFL